MQLGLFSHPRPANETELTAEWELLCYQREILNWVQHFQFHSVTVIMNLSCLCILFWYFLIPFDRDWGKKNTFTFRNFLPFSLERSTARARMRDCQAVELLENLVSDEGRINGNRQWVTCRNADLKYWSCTVSSQCLLCHIAKTQPSPLGLFNSPLIVKQIEQLSVGCSLPSQKGNGTEAMATTHKDMKREKPDWALMLANALAPGEHKLTTSTLSQFKVL